MKISRQYHAFEKEIPEPERDIFIARRRSYHGTTLGALGISGFQTRRDPYEPILPNNTRFISPCYPYRDIGGRSEAQYVEDLKNEFEQEIRAIGPRRVAGLFVEPVVGAVSSCCPPFVFRNQQAVASSRTPLIRRVGPWLRACRYRLPQGYAGCLQRSWHFVYSRRNHVRLRPHRLHARISATWGSPRHPATWQRSRGWLRAHLSHACIGENRASFLGRIRNWDIQSWSHISEPCWFLRTSIGGTGNHRERQVDQERPSPGTSARTIVTHWSRRSPECWRHSGGGLLLECQYSFIPVSIRSANSNQLEFVRDRASKEPFEASRSIAWRLHELGM